MGQCRWTSRKWCSIVASVLVRSVTQKRVSMLTRVSLKVGDLRWTMMYVVARGKVIVDGTGVDRIRWRSAVGRWFGLTLRSCSRNQADLMVSCVTS